MPSPLAFIFDLWGPLPAYSWICLILLVALLVFYFGFYRRRAQ